MEQQEWDYLVLGMTGDAGDKETRLKNLGSEGWEVVAVAVQFTTHTVYMKRPKWGHSAAARSA